MPFSCPNCGATTEERPEGGYCEACQRWTGSYTYHTSSERMREIYERWEQMELEEADRPRHWETIRPNPAYL